MSEIFKILSDLSAITRTDLRAGEILAKLQREEDILLATTYLFTASRKGHLCVRVSDVLLPSLEYVWPEATAVPELPGRLRNGFLQIDPAETSIIRENDRYYLPKNHAAEKEILTLFDNLTETSPVPSCEGVEEEESTLSPEQKKAVSCALQYSPSFICGGPGVGKTHTAAELVKIFLSRHPEGRVALLAPTGKAAFNFQSYLSKKVTGAKNIHVSTLHKLFYRLPVSFLPYDLVLVDESSMIDTLLMKNLLKYQKPKARLVFLGDQNQLLPIESGSLFIDLADRSKAKVELKECLRTDIREILQIADAVKEGKTAEATEQMQMANIYHPLPEKQDDSFLRMISRHYRTAPKEKQSPGELWAGFQKFKILSPARQGPFGVDAVNQAILSSVSSSSPIPIMITKNDYASELYNGDLGVILGEKQVVFPLRHPEQSFADPAQGIRLFPLALLHHYEYAYALSVHKSQGSEYDHVIILLPSGSEVFGRQMLYTAITRAKKSVRIFSSPEVLAKTIEMKLFRVSGLS